MIHKLEALGVAMIAVFAMSAVAASAAQAGEFTAEKYPATITGTQLGKHQFQFNGGAVSCNAALFEGGLAGPANLLTISAQYGECSTAGGAGVVINMTSCDYRFHANETLQMDRVDGSLDVQCAQAGDEIDIEEAGGCVVKIPAQLGLNTLVYTNHTAAKDFDVDIALANIEYTQNAACPGGAGVFFNGTYSGQSTMTADFEGAGVGTIVD